MRNFIKRMTMKAPRVVSSTIFISGVLIVTGVLALFPQIRDIHYGGITLIRFLEWLTISILLRIIITKKAEEWKKEAKGE
ncbi:hypothetical protein SB5439_05140 [Klebsiella variicola]|nr:hypothetical protein SB5439_05140 [Klebsiella variicola]